METYTNSIRNSHLPITKLQQKIILDDGLLLILSIKLKGSYTRRWGHTGKPDRVPSAGAAIPVGAERQRATSRRQISDCTVAQTGRPVKEGSGSWVVAEGSWAGDMRAESTGGKGSPGGCRGRGTAWTEARGRECAAWVRGRGRGGRRVAGVSEVIERPRGSPDLRREAASESNPGRRRWGSGQQLVENKEVRKTSVLAMIGDLPSSGLSFPSRRKHPGWKL